MKVVTDPKYGTEGESRTEVAMIEAMETGVDIR